MLASYLSTRPQNRVTIIPERHSRRRESRAEAWTKHAEQRLKEWEEKKQIAHAEIERVILDPDQLVRSDLNIHIAQSRRENGLLCVAFSKHRWAGRFSPSLGQANWRSIGRGEALGGKAFG